MNANGIFGLNHIEERMCGNMIDLLWRISVRNVYQSSWMMYKKTMNKEENMDNTVTRIERRSDGSYIVTVNGKNFECEDTQAMLNFLEEVGEGKI